jgi:putative membrane protein
LKNAPQSTNNYPIYEKNTPARLIHLWLGLFSTPFPKNRLISGSRLGKLIRPINHRNLLVCDIILTVLGENYMRCRLLINKTINRLFMKKLSGIIVIALTAGMFAACNGTGKGNNTDSISQPNKDSAVQSSTATVPDTSKMAASVDTGDVKFAREAASGGMTEVQLGKIAFQKGVSQKVKDFGQMMVTDHSKANNEFMALARKKNIVLPTAPNADDQKVIDELSQKSGTDFDKAYVDDMVKDHKKDIAAFKDAAKNCKDPDIKAFAANTLPVLQKHLDAINAIKKGM